MKNLILITSLLFLTGCSSSTINNSNTGNIGVVSAENSLTLNYEGASIVLKENSSDPDNSSNAYHAPGAGIGLTAKGILPNKQKFSLFISFLGKSKPNSNQRIALDKGFKKEDIDINTLQVGFNRGSENFNIVSSEARNNSKLEFKDTNQNLIGTFEGTLSQPGNATSNIPLSVSFNFVFPTKPPA